MSFDRCSGLLTAEAVNRVAHNTRVAGGCRQARERE